MTTTKRKKKSSSSTTPQNEQKNEQQNNDDDTNKSKLLTQLINIQMPRCSVCSTSWFSDKEIKRKNQTFQQNINLYIEERVQDFIPFPRCECTTTLFTNPIGSKLDDILLQILNIHHNDDNNTSLCCSSSTTRSHNNVRNYKKTQWTNDKIILDIIFNQSQISIHDITSFPNKGICRLCLQNFIRSAEDVITHDYRDDNQPNIKFSTKKNCPYCNKKFSPKNLDALLDYNPTVSFSGGAGSGGSSSAVGRKHNGKGKGKNNNIMSWNDSVVNTVKFVRFSKKLKKALIDRELGKRSSSSYQRKQDCSTLESDSIIDNNCHDNDNIIIKDIEASIHPISKDINRWISDDVSSDGCFSCSTDENDDDDDDDLRMKSVHNKMKYFSCKSVDSLDSLDSDDEDEGDDDDMNQLERDKQLALDLEKEWNDSNNNVENRNNNLHHDNELLENDEKLAMELDKQWNTLNHKNNHTKKLPTILNYLNKDKKTKMCKSPERKVSTSFMNLDHSSRSSSNQNVPMSFKSIDSSDDQLKKDQKLAMELDKQLNHSNVISDNIKIPNPSTILNYMTKKDLKMQRRKNIEKRQSSSTVVAPKSKVLIISLDPEIQKKRINHHVNLSNLVSGSSAGNESSDDEVEVIGFSKNPGVKISITDKKATDASASTSTSSNTNTTTNSFQVHFQGENGVKPIFMDDLNDDESSSEGASRKRKSDEFSHVHQPIPTPIDLTDDHCSTHSEQQNTQHVHSNPTTIDLFSYDD